MNNFIDEFVNVLTDLYNLYENYMWKHDDSNLEVLMQDRTICFYLYKNKEVIDELILSFDEKEQGIYAYMCIRLMIIMLGNVIVNIDNNILYNNMHKPYLKLIVNDEGILDSMSRILAFQYKIVIHGKMEILEMVRNRLPRKVYPRKFMRTLNDRVGMSRKLLRTDGVR